MTKLYKRDRAEIDSRCHKCGDEQCNSCKEASKQYIINRLIGCQSVIDETTKLQADLKSELLPHLPGYHKPGTVMTYTGNRRDLFKRVEIVEQVVWLKAGVWSIVKTYGSSINSGGYNMGRFNFLNIGLYHPEAPGKENDK